VAHSSSHRHGARPRRRKKPATYRVLGPQAAALKVTQAGARRLYARRLRTVHVAFILFFGTLLSIGPLDGVGDHRVAATAGGAIFGITVLACIAVLRRGIVVTPDLVTVRGLVTTRRIPAATIAGFEPPPAYGTWWRPGMRIVLTDGRIRTCGALTNTPVDAGHAGTRETDELNLWLAARSESGASTTSALPGKGEDDWAVRLVWRGWLTLLTLFALMCLAGVLSALTDPAFGLSN
jgi:hypothetical protein